MIFYADFWPGSPIDTLTLQVNPGPKMVGAIRLRIGIDIPEMNDPDYHVEATAEIDNDEDTDSDHSG